MGPFKITLMVVQTPPLVLVRFKTALAITTPRWAPEQAPALGLGSNNILIGDAGLSSSFDVISIGAIPSSGIPYSRTYIGGIYNSVEQDRPVYVDSHGHLGSPASSRRYKEEIKPMDKGSEALFALKPVTFRYKQQIDPSHRLSFGLIAEDVAKVSADLIGIRKVNRKPSVTTL